MSEEIKGTEDFVNASDEWYKYVASIIRKKIEDKSEKLEEVREISEIVRITTSSIKTQKEESKGKKSPADKIKARSNGEQTVV